MRLLSTVRVPTFWSMLNAALLDWFTPYKYIGVFGSSADKQYGFPEALRRYEIVFHSITFVVLPEFTYTNPQLLDPGSFICNVSLITRFPTAELDNSKKTPSV